MRHTDWKHAVLAASLVLIWLATLLGNTLVCLTVYRRRKLRTRTNMFVVNLACADIGVALLCMPFSLVTCLSNEWILGDVGCQVNGFLNILLTQTSLLTLTAISIETYFAIVRPMYHRIMGKRNFYYLLLWTWLQPSLIAVVPLTGFMTYEFKKGSTQCGVKFPSRLEEIIFGSGVILVAYLVPVVIMGFTYINTIRSARRHSRRLSRVSSASSLSNGNPSMSHRQVALTVLMLVAVFIACWTPYFVFVTMVTFEHALTSNEHVVNLGQASYWCAFTCSALNPFVYGYRNPQFRKEFRYLLCFLCPCLSLRKAGRGCSASCSKGSRDGSSFEYNYLRRFSTPCVSPANVRARPSVDFGFFGGKITGAQAPNPVTRTSSDPGYVSGQEDSNAPRPGRAGSDEIQPEAGLAFSLYRGSDSQELATSPVGQTTSLTDLLRTPNAERKGSFNAITRRNLKLGWIETRL